MSRDKKRIAVIIDYMTSDYSVIFLAGIKDACADYDLEFLTFPIGEINSFAGPYDYQRLSITSHIAKCNVDGILIQSSSQMHFITKAELTSYIKSYKSLPIINVTTQLSGIPSITVDCKNAYRALLTNLVREQNCKKFGIIGVRSNSSEIKTRTKAVKDILSELEIPEENMTMWKSTFDYENTFSELELYYKSQPENCENPFDFDALVAFNDEMGFACMDFCKKIGKRIPQDIVIVGYDDIERSAFSNPPLTSINQQIFEQGYEAVRLLNDEMNRLEVPMHTVIDAKAIVRESTLRKPDSTKENTEFLKFEKLHQVDISGNVTNSVFLQNEWYQKRSQFYQVTKFYTDMQNGMSLNQLQKRINADLKSFGMSAMAIVVYKNPIEMETPFEHFHMPHKAFVFSVFDEITGIDMNASGDKVYFDPNEFIIPDNLININQSGMYVLPLFHNSLQYGYMIFRKGNYDVSIYDLVSKIVCTIISSVYSFDLISVQTEKIKSQYSKLDIVANTDELTKLYNRRGLFELSHAKLEKAKKKKTKGYVVYCDIDGLKQINDTFGHESGDVAIIAESKILKRYFGKTDVVARIGGDEFVIVGEGSSYEELEAIRKRIDDECEKWVIKNKSQFKLSISMGFVTFPSDKSEYQLTSLLSEADNALYAEKRRKKTI